MTKKIKENLQDSNKSSIFAPGIAQDKSQVVFEKCSAAPCNAWKPKEAMSIREMLIRTERGQRLDVNTRFRAEGIPDNMYKMEFDSEGRPLPDKYEENFEHTPPDGVVDIVDVIRLQEETDARKEELRKKRKQQTVANAPKAVPKPDPDPKEKRVHGADPTKETE